MLASTGPLVSPDVVIGVLRMLPLLLSPARVCSRESPLKSERQSARSYGFPSYQSTLGSGQHGQFMNSAYSVPNYSGYTYSEPYKDPYLTAEENYGSVDVSRYPLTTASPEACKSTTFRTNLGCPCRLISQRCHQPNSVCTADVLGDGYCRCTRGLIPYNLQCLTAVQYASQTATIPSSATSTPSLFQIFSPTVTASCALPLNAPFASVGSSGGNGSLTYALKLLSSSPLGDTVQHVDIDPSKGNLIYKSIAPYSVANQLYSLTATDTRGNTTTRNFTVAYSCPVPTCMFDFGNSLIVDCLRFTLGETVVRVLANATIAPTTFSMSLISSSSRNGNNFFRIVPDTGQVIIQKIPHGGVFVENYSVAATNTAGASCSPLTLTLTTTETCV